MRTSDKNPVPPPPPHHPCLQGEDKHSLAALHLLSQAAGVAPGAPPPELPHSDEPDQVIVGICMWLDACMNGHGVRCQINAKLGREGTRGGFGAVLLIKFGLWYRTRIFYVAAGSPMVALKSRVVRTARSALQASLVFGGAITLFSSNSTPETSKI